MLLQFVSAQPNEPFPRYGLAMEYKNLGQLEEAARAFGELMTRYPDYTAAYLHAGNTLVELGRRHEARQVYQVGIEACRRKGDAHALGELEAALGLL